MAYWKGRMSLKVKAQKKPRNGRISRFTVLGEKFIGTLKKKRSEGFKMTFSLKHLVVS